MTTRNNVRPNSNITSAFYQKKKKLGFDNISEPHIVYRSNVILLNNNTCVLVV